MATDAVYNTTPKLLVDGERTSFSVTERGALRVALDGAQTAANAAGDLDTNGNPVPTYKGHTYTYDGSGNVATDRVTDGANIWVRTFTYQNGALSSDSGWVKQ